MKRQYFLKIFFTFLTLGFIIFIFSNSLFPGPESSEKSRAVMQTINRFLSAFGLGPVTEYFIRKLAHFTEYFALGVLLTATVRMYDTKPFRLIFTELFILLSVPVLDEFLQTLIPARNGDVRDVLLDFSGGLLATALCLAAMLLFDLHKANQKKAADSRR